VQRPDDREDVIENWLRVYESQTRPLIDHYRRDLKVVDAHCSSTACTRISAAAGG
jgi:adenylate kinase family enzyme